MTTDLTISIVNYNDRDSLVQCLASIEEHRDGLQVEMFVVDNGSRDGSVEAVRRLYPGVTVIANPENRGFAAGNNQVLRQLRGRYCLITNPDVVMMPGSLRAMVNFMDACPDAGAAGCKILNQDRSLQYSCRRYPTLLALMSRGLLLDELYPLSRHCAKYLMKDSDHEKIAPVDWVTGCCLLVRRDTLAEVGLLDEGYFMYFEDVDLCYRINRGWKVYYVPTAGMIHEFRHRSRGRLALRQSYQHWRSALRFFSKYGPVPGRPRWALRNGIPGGLQDP